MPHPSTPILVGGGQKTWRVTSEDMPTALEMIETAARLALADTGAEAAAGAALDTVATIEFTIDAPYFKDMGIPKPKNSATGLARVLGKTDAYTIQCGGPGGNSPQQMINYIAEKIARDDVGLAVISGAEFLNNYWTLVRSGAPMDHWRTDDPDPSEKIGEARDGESAIEQANGMERPTNVYPLIENAIRAERGATVAEHLASMGRLMAPFTKVAAANPYAWFPVERSAEEIATEGPKNRMVGFPYTKYMNAIMRVDMAAAVVLTSVGKARELGIPEDRWVYLHGCGDAKDVWNVTERPELTRSPAIAGCWQRASAMADIGADDLNYIDLYSCFPSAVEIACREIGLAEDDPRGLTVTGGLPYFGGPGNNYAMHSVVTMLDKLRADPCSFGLCTANGWYVTKHSLGIYSTEPVEGEWAREDPKVLQAELDAGSRVEVAEKPEGKGTVETSTLVYGRGGPMMGIVVGRLEDGRRFVAKTEIDEKTIAALRADDSAGRKGTVAAGEGLKNKFVFD